MKKNLNLKDSVSLIVGIMLGIGIFDTFPALAAKHCGSNFLIFFSWVLASFIAWFGALSYAELASIFPQNGGAYIFLREAYKYKNNNPVSFLFGWAQIFIIRPASLLSLSIIMSKNLLAIIVYFGISSMEGATSLLPYAIILSLFFFTMICIIGVKLSKNFQNILTFFKIFILMNIIILGFYYGKSKFFDLNWEIFPNERNIFRGFFGVGLSLIPIMWVYGGWDEAPYVSGEVNNPEKNIPKSLTISVLGLSLMYLMVNFIYVLHFNVNGLSNCFNPAETIINSIMGKAGALFIAITIFISAAGAVNGLIFTGGRMTQAFSVDYSLFHFTSIINKRFSTPVRALLFNFFITVILAGVLGFASHSIEKLLFFTSGVVWLFFFLIVLSVFIFRFKKGISKIPFKTPFFPFPQIVFLIMSLAMIYGAIDYKPVETLTGLFILGTGIPIYYLYLFIMKKNRDK